MTSEETTAGEPGPGPDPSASPAVPVTGQPSPAAADGQTTAAADAQSTPVAGGQGAAVAAEPAAAAVGTETPVKPAAAGAPPKTSHHRWRRSGAWVSLILACILAVVSLLVVFVRQEVLDTDTYVSTVAPLARNPAVEAYAATLITNEATSKVDVQKILNDRLPKRLQFLAAPAASAFPQIVHHVATAIVTSAAFVAIWDAVNRAAHKQVVKLLTGQGRVLSSDHGKVVLDLKKVAVLVRDRLDAHGIHTFDHILGRVDGPQFVLFQSQSLGRAQTLVRRLNRLSILLPILTVLLLVLSVIAALDRRRGIIRLGIGIAVAFGLLGVILALARHFYLQATAKVISGSAAAAMFDIVLTLPKDVTRSLVVIGVLIALGAALYGRVRFRAPAADSPFGRWIGRYQRLVQAGVLAVGALVVVWWNDATPVALIVIGGLTLVLLVVVQVLAGSGAGSSAPAGAAGATGGSGTAS